MMTECKFLFLLIAATVVCGCAKQKPPVGLVGRWENKQMGLTSIITQRVVLHDDWTYTVAHTAAPTSEGKTTKDGLEIVHSGDYHLDKDSGALVFNPSYLPTAGVNTAALAGGPLKSTYRVAGNTLTIDDAPAVLLATSNPGKPTAGASPMPGPVASGPVTLTRVP